MSCIVVFSVLYTQNQRNLLFVFDLKDGLILVNDPEKCVSSEVPPFIRSQYNFVGKFEFQKSAPGELWRFTFQCCPFVNAATGDAAGTRYKNQCMLFAVLSTSKHCIHLLL